METPISLEWAGSRAMTSLIVTVRSGVRKRTTITVLVWEMKIYIEVFEFHLETRWADSLRHVFSSSAG